MPPGTFRPLSMLQPSRRFVIVLRRLLLITAGVLVVSIGTLLVLASVYEEEVKAKLIASINAHLKVPVQQSGIDLTLIRRFPNASLRISDVLVREVRTDSASADTLLFARQLDLEFSLLAMLRGDYTVDRLHGENVCLQPGLDANGAQNWSIWKEDTAAGDGVDLKLRKVKFDGLRTRYTDARSGLLVRSSSERLSLEGRIRPEGSHMEVSGDATLQLLMRGKKTLLTDRSAGLKLSLAFGAPDGSFHIEKGSELLLGGSTLAVTLDLSKGEKGSELDLRANGFSMPLGETIALLPEQAHRQLQRYALDGEADIALRCSGPIDGVGPALSMGMSLRDGRFQEQRSGASFDKVRGEFALELTPTGAARKITIKGFNARCASGSISGTAELKGGTNAPLRMHAQADLAIADLMRFAGVDTLEEAAGRLKADITVNGKLRDPAHFKASDLRTLAISGTADLRDASLKLRGVRHRLSALDASLALKGNDAIVRGLRCELQGNSIALDGTLKNLVPYLLFTDQHLMVDANGSSPRIDLGTLLAAASSSDSPASSNYVVRFPAGVDLALHANVDELVFEDFSATEIRGDISLNDQVLRVKPMTFRSAQGQAEGSLSLDARSTPAYPLSIVASVKNMDISGLFTEFRNFGQQFITDRHLRGKSDVRLTLTALLSPALTLDQQSLHCVADVSIRDGELNGHAPMMAVADYVRTNKLISPFVDTDELQQRLSHVRFASLQNQIEVKDRTVHVPSMLVRSSAMDIEVSAAQGFDGDVDDHLNFRLAELFRKQAPEDEFGPVIDDGTGLRVFLHMYGTTSDLRFKNDGAAASARRQQKFKQETVELKNILSDMWHGRSQPVPHDQPPGVITIEPETKDSTSKAPALARVQDRKKGLGRLLEKRDEEEQETITIE